MLKQIEGSHAVAEAVALCRPEVICAYPISPQTHIVEALGEMVKSGALAPCEFINVESEFAAMSVAIGASAAGARAYTATASQGLLFMAEAVFNASGPRPADRDDGRQPRDRRADQHLERPPIRCRSATAAGSSCSPKTTRKRSTCIQAFKLAEELSLPVMVCMDGFILTHAYERVDMPDAGAGRRVTCRPSSRARCSTRTSRCRSARWSARRPSPKCAISRIQADAGARADPEVGGRVSQRVRTRGRRLGAAVPHRRRRDRGDALGSVLGTIKDTVDELRDEGVESGCLA